MKTKEEILAPIKNGLDEHILLLKEINKHADLITMEGYYDYQTAGEANEALVSLERYLTLKDETITGLSKLNEIGIQMQATLQGEMDKLFDRVKILEIALGEIIGQFELVEPLFGKDRTVIKIAKQALAGKD